MDRGVLQGVLVVPDARGPDRLARRTCAGSPRPARSWRPIVSEARAVGPVRRPRAPAARRDRAKPVVELGRRERGHSSGTSIPVAWRACDHNPLALLQCVSGRSDRAARVAARACTAASTRPTGGCRIPRVEAHLGCPPRERPGRAAGRLFLRRVRPSRVDSDLFGRARRSCRRPSQERVRPGHSARSASASTTTRVISGSGSTATTGSARSTSHVDHRVAADPAGDTRWRAGHGGNRDADRPDRRARLAARRRAEHAAPARLERRRQQPGRPGSHGAALRRRSARAHPPGTAARRRRGPRTGGAGDLARGHPSERGAQCVCPAGARPAPHADRRHRRGAKRCAV